MKKAIIYSAEQSACINHIKSKPGKPIAVRARAGTGKSQTSIGMIEAAPESSIVTIQFNKRNQVEMTERITDPRCSVLTFHAACNRFVAKNWGFMKAQSFWAEANRVNSIDSTCKGFPLNQVTKLIGALKNEVPAVPTEEQAMKVALKYGIEDCTNQKFPLENIVALAVKSIPLCLEKSKTKQISFEDMIFVPLVNGWVQPIAELVIGDEFQDFNPVQHAVFQKFYGSRAGILGDDRQQIYGWRGAVNNGFDSMITALGAEVYPMTTTRRCAQKIVEYAKQWVPDFTAHESAPIGEVNSVSFGEMIKQAVPGNAILSRTNAPLMATCLNFIRNGIPSRIEGRDIASQLDGILKQVADTNDDIVNFLNKLESWKLVRISKAQGWNAQATIDFVCDQADTLKVLAESVNSVSEMSGKINLLFEDSNGTEKPSVKCSTIHKAKGLEWEKVFILQNSFSNRGGTTEEQKREEENIRYVAATRARHSLNLVQGLTPKDN